MEGKTNTKKKALTKNKLQKKIVKKRIVRKSKALLDISDLGVHQDHILSAEVFNDPVPKTVFIKGIIASNPNPVFHRPLASARVSFWLGVGFGTLVVGTLAILVWQLIRLDLIETVVVGLIR